MHLRHRSTRDFRQGGAFNRILSPVKQPSTTDIRIRNAKRDDAEALLALYCEVHDAHLEMHPDEFDDLTPEEEASLLRRFASTDPACLYVAETEGGLVGCVRFDTLRHRGRNRESAQRYLYIDLLVVAPKWQNRGIGRALLAQVHECARELGVREIELHVYEFNAAGLHLYASLGYRSMSRRMKINLE